MIDLDPLWRLVILLAAASVLPLLFALNWVARWTRDAYNIVLLRSWWRGQRHRFHRHASTPTGPERARHALDPARHRPRRAP